MRALFFISLFLFVFRFRLYSQNDSTEYSAIRYVPRMAVGYQKSAGFELGFCRQNMHYSVKGGGCTDAYIGNEFVFSNAKMIVGPKLGAELMIAGNIAILLGIDGTLYTDGSNSSLAITPRFFIPLTRNCTPLLFLSYGYNYFSSDAFREEIGRHKFSLIFNLNLKNHKEINNFYKRLYASPSQ